MSTLYAHPWMRGTHSSRKRTHSSDDTNSDDDVAPSTPAQVQRHPRAPTTTPPPPGLHARKRFRASGLEGTLAKLSLTPPPPPAPRLYPHNVPDLDQSQSSYGDDLEMAVEDVPQAQFVSSGHSFAAPLAIRPEGPGRGEGEMLRNGTVEEPAPAPEIRMHATSWYEPTPDRIIVTDLDGSDADDERETSSEPVILPSALEMLQKRLHGVGAVPGLPRPSSEGLALVPFRPPLFSAPPSLGFEDQAPAQRGIVEEGEDDDERKRGSGEVEEDGGVLADEEDGMGVEPMDVEL